MTPRITVVGSINLDLVARCGRFPRPERFLRGGRSAPRPDDLTLIQFDDPIAEMKVPIVMGDDRHALASGTQLGKQFGVEDLFVLGVLVGRPLIEHIERSVFEVRCQQGQPPPLALGQISRREPLLRDPHFLIKL